MSSVSKNGVKLDEPEKVLSRYAHQIGRYMEDELEDIKDVDTDRFATTIKFRARDLPGKSYSDAVVGKALRSLEGEVECFTKENTLYRVNVADAKKLSESLKDVESLPTYVREVATIERMVRDSPRTFEQQEEIKEAFMEEMKSFDEDYAESIDIGIVSRRLERSDKLNFMDGKWKYGHDTNNRLNE